MPVLFPLKRANTAAFGKQLLAGMLGDRAAGQGPGARGQGPWAMGHGGGGGGGLGAGAVGGLAGSPLVIR
jgi:hypothetical protein